MGEVWLERLLEKRGFDWGCAAGGIDYFARISQSSLMVVYTIGFCIVTRRSAKLSVVALLSRSVSVLSITSKWLKTASVERK